MIHTHQKRRLRIFAKSREKEVCSDEMNIVIRSMQRGKNATWWWRCVRCFCGRVLRTYFAILHNFFPLMRMTMMMCVIPSFFFDPIKKSLMGWNLMEWCMWRDWSGRDVSSFPQLWALRVQKSANIIAVRLNDRRHHRRRDDDHHVVMVMTMIIVFLL